MILGMDPLLIAFFVACLFFSFIQMAALAVIAGGFLAGMPLGVLPKWDSAPGQPSGSLSPNPSHSRPAFPPAAH